MSLNIPYVGVGYHVNKHFDKQQQIGYVQSWQMNHYRQHAMFFMFLSSLESAVNNKEYKINLHLLTWNVQDAGAFNNFIYHDNFQHEQFYDWINELGADLANYNKPPIVVYAKLNPMLRVNELNMETYNKFFLQEQETHKLIIIGIRQLYSAYGL